MKLMIFYDKHTRYFLLNPPLIHEQAILQKVFREWQDEGYYFIDEMEKDEKKLYKKALKGDVVPFMKFRSRVGAEYEVYEIVEFEQVIE